MLLDFLKEARLDRVGCFQYSPVDGASANDLPDQVDDVKEDPGAGTAIAAAAADLRRAPAGKVGR
jgi:hypothetical protein